MAPKKKKSFVTNTATNMPSEDIWSFLRICSRANLLSAVRFWETPT
jgi:hypothetical protein